MDRIRDIRDEGVASPAERNEPIRDPRLLASPSAHSGRTP